MGIASLNPSYKLLLMQCTIAKKGRGDYNG